MDFTNVQQIHLILVLQIILESFKEEYFIWSSIITEVFFIAFDMIAIVLDEIKHMIKNLSFIPLKPIWIL